MGSVLKGAALSSRLLRKGKGPSAPQEPTGEKGRLRGASPWVIGWGIGAAVFLVVALVSSYTQVEAGTVGVVKRLGKVQQSVFEPGFHFKIPFLDQVVLYSTKVTRYEA